MTRIPLIPDLLDAEDEDGQWARSRAWLRAGDAESRAAGILLRAALLWRQREPEAALRQLRDGRRLLGTSTVPLVANILWLTRTTQAPHLAVPDCLDFARDALQQGQDNAALEACAAALILDAQGDYALIKSPPQLRAVAEFYEQVAARHAPDLQPPLRPRRSGPWRVALVVPNLVDDVVAYTKTTLHLARHLPRGQAELRVFVSENSSQRQRPLFPFGCIGGRSEATGARTLAELAAHGVPVSIAARDVPLVEGAQALARAITATEPDLALFLTGMACPGDWLAARWLPVPVKAAIHIGTSLFLRGLDATLYDNPANCAREDGAWDPAMGARRTWRAGVDLDELRQTPPLARATLGIPADAVVIGTLSNHLDQRLSPAYLEIIAHLLRDHPEAWFTPIGAGALPEKLPVFHAAGVAGRVRFIDRQPQPAAALKLLDIYANEFPVGGSTSVMEAMACGVPVAALRWSAAHAECAGAEIAGPDFAMPGPDLAAYRALLEDWIRHPDRRQAAGRRMRERAETLFSARTSVQDLLAQLIALYDSKRDERG